VDDRKVVRVPWLHKDILKQLLIRENELRLCKEIQQEYAEAERRTDTNWMIVTEKLQLKVLQEFGITNTDEGLYALRTAALAFPDDPEICNIQLYVKYNRTRKGTLIQGDLAPNVTLHKLDNSFINLLQCVRKGIPLVVIGGSYS